MYREIMWYEYMPTWFLVYSAISLFVLAVAVSDDAGKRKGDVAGWFIAVLLFNFVGVLAYFITRGSREIIDMKVGHQKDSKTIQTSHISIFRDLKSELDRRYPDEKIRQGKRYYHILTELGPEEKYKISVTLESGGLKITAKNDEFEKILEIVKGLIRDVKNPNYLNISGL